MTMGFHIDPDLCTECVGFADAPQCVDICPADCIVKDPKHAETKEELKKKDYQTASHQSRNLSL